MREILSPTILSSVEVVIRAAEDNPALRISLEQILRILFVLEAIETPSHRDIQTQRLHEEASALRHLASVMDEAVT